MDVKLVGDIKFSAAANKYEYEDILIEIAAVMEKHKIVKIDLAIDAFATDNDKNSI